MGVRRALPRRAHGGDAGEVSAPQPSLRAPEITLVRGRGSFAAEVFLLSMSSPCPSPQGRGKATVTASATTRPSPPVFVPIYPELFTRRCVFRKRGGKVPRGGPWRYSPAGSAPRTPSLTFISRPDWGRTRVGEKKGAASEAVPPRFPPPSPLPPPETRGGGAGELPPPRVPALSGPGLGTKEGERRCCRC